MLDGGSTTWVDINLERQIVATMLAGMSTFDPTLVKTDYFTNQALRTIWDISFREWLAGRPVDVVTVSGALAKSGVLDAVGGDIGLTKLVSWLPSGATDKHCRGLENLWQRRTTQMALQRAANDLESGSVPIKEIIATFDSKAMIAIGEENNSYANKESELDECLHQILNPMDSDCVATPWPSIDKLIGGLRPEEMVVLAGRPGMGKTALMVTAQRDLAKRGIPTLTFSLDMGRKQLWNRYISQEVGIGVSELERGVAFTSSDEALILGGVARIKEMPLWVDTNPYRSLAEIRMIVRQHVAKYDTQVVFIDHIGKIRPDKANSRQEEVSVIAQGLKAMSKEFRICIAPLVQLNRNVELRADKRPMISDIRESGSIEQEADIILMAYRPEYYDLTTFTDNTTSSIGRMELIAAKCRNGSTGSAFLDFKGKFTFVGEPDKTALFSEQVDMPNWEKDEHIHQLQAFN